MLSRNTWKFKKCLTTKKFCKLLIALLLINLITLWTYTFRENYIIYHNIQIYYTFSLFVIAISVLIGIICQSNIKRIFTILVSISGISLFLAVPLSFYPDIVNNPDVIKMLELTYLILNGDFNLAKYYDYSAFPGFSYIVGTISLITGIPLRIKLASLIYIISSSILLITAFALGKRSNWISMYLLVLFSSGFIYSFEYLSPQLFGQILIITSLVILLNNKLPTTIRFVLLFLCYCGTILTHPESMLMLLIIFTLYFGTTEFIIKKSKVDTFSKITLMLVTLVSYMIFFVQSSGPEYILKSPIECLIKIEEIIFQTIQNKGESVVTSSSIKPQFIQVLSKINILYNAILLMFSTYILWFYKRRYFILGILLISFFISAGMFLVIFGFSFGEFIGRPAFGVSLIIAIIISRYLTEKRNFKILAFTIVSFIILLLATFPARVAPQEWNVLSINYYPPIIFLSWHDVKEYNIYYFLYPNYPKTKDAKYVILPVGQKPYISGIKKFLGWNVKKSMYQTIRHNSVIYSNKLSNIAIMD